MLTSSDKTWGFPRTRLRKRNTSLKCMLHLMSSLSKRMRNLILILTAVDFTLVTQHISSVSCPEMLYH
jgi:hypothetical protein